MWARGSFTREATPTKHRGSPWGLKVNYSHSLMIKGFASAELNKFTSALNSHFYSTLPTRAAHFDRSSGGCCRCSHRPNRSTSSKRCPNRTYQANYSSSNRGNPQSSSLNRNDNPRLAKIYYYRLFLRLLYNHLHHFG